MQTSDKRASRRFSLEETIRALEENAKSLTAEQLDKIEGRLALFPRLGSHKKLIKHAKRIIAQLRRAGNWVH